MIERRAEAAVVVILERDETKWLQHTSRRLAHGAEDFGHAVYGARMRLKRKFNEGTAAERSRQLQESARRRNGLKFGFCTPAIF